MAKVVTSMALFFPKQGSLDMLQPNPETVRLEGKWVEQTLHQSTSGQ